MECILAVVVWTAVPIHSYQVSSTCSRVVGMIFVWYRSAETAYNIVTFFPVAVSRDNAVGVALGKPPPLHVCGSVIRQNGVDWACFNRRRKRVLEGLFHFLSDPTQTEVSNYCFDFIFCVAKTTYPAVYQHKGAVMASWFFALPRGQPWPRNMPKQARPHSLDRNRVSVSSNSERKILKYQYTVGKTKKRACYRCSYNTTSLRLHVRAASVGQPRFWNTVLDIWLSRGFLFEKREMQRWHQGAVKNTRGGKKYSFSKKRRVCGLIRVNNEERSGWALPLLHYHLVKPQTL